MTPVYDVVLVSSASEPVGVCVHIINLAVLLRSRNVNIRVVCPRDGWLVHEMDKINVGVTIIDTGTSFIGGLFGNIKFFVLALHYFHQGTIVHLHGRYACLVSALWRLVCRKSKYVVTIHQFETRSSNPIAAAKLWFEARAVKRAEAVICVSKALRTDCFTRFPSLSPSRVRVIPNWISRYDAKEDKSFDVGPNLNRPQCKRAALKVCFVGRLVPEKGISLLIEALNLLKTSGVDVCCDVYGEGPLLKTAQLQIETYNLDKIRFRGVDPCVRGRLTEYDMVVVPSLTESFSLVALEAFDAETLVVASDIPGLNEVVVGGKTGLSFTSGSALNLANTLLAAHDMDQTARDIIIGGAKAALGTNYSEPVVGGAYLELYAKCVEAI